MSGFSACPFCPEPIMPGDRVRFEVIGWEKDRPQGGTNALELRERTGKVAHARCVERAKHVHPDQGELLE